jgi:hypothetical protein
MEAVQKLVGAVLNDAEVCHHVALAHACGAQKSARWCTCCVMTADKMDA